MGARVPAHPQHMRAHTHTHTLTHTHIHSHTHRLTHTHIDSHTHRLTHTHTHTQTHTHTHTQTYTMRDHSPTETVWTEAKGRGKLNSKAERKTMPFWCCLIAIG